jgi:hypothetical protein
VAGDEPYGARYRGLWHKQGEVEGEMNKRAATTKESYEALMASGMLWEMLPEAKGEWEQDKYLYADTILRAQIGFQQWQTAQNEWPDVIEYDR